jgi:hypothetical protein
LNAEADTWEYAYSSLEERTEAGCKAVVEWLPDSMGEKVVLERSVWCIDDWYVTTVLRNRRWWNDMGKPAYEKFWAAVDQARSTGEFASRLLIEDSDSDSDSDSKISEGEVEK